MAFSVNLNNLDALVGVTFGAGGFANLNATFVDGSISNSASSPNEILTYNGTTAGVGYSFFPLPMKTLSLVVAAIDDTDNTLTIDALVGKTVVGVMNFTVVGFSAEGIALAAMPLASLVTQAGNLPALTGQLFELGFNTTATIGMSIVYDIAGTYNFINGAGVHYITAANQVFQAGSGPQMMYGLSGNETITAGSGVTLIYAGPGTNVLTAGSGKDTIFGGSGQDTIIGGSGTDVLHGGSGTEVIDAGSGHSVLIGGAGTDTFVFAPGHTGGSTAATADIIQHFLPGENDTIKLTAFDASLPAAAGGHMRFIGTAAFDHHVGEVRYDVTSTGVTVWGDINGDGVADFVFTMTKISSLAANMFIL